MPLFERMKESKISKKGEEKVTATINIPKSKVRLLEKGEDVVIRIRGINFVVRLEDLVAAE